LGQVREYYFKASRLGGMHVGVDAAGVSVRTDRPAESHGYSRRVEFADLKQVTVSERYGRRSISESLDLVPETGKSALFGITIGVNSNKGAELRIYRQAAAAVLQAYSDAKPEAPVRYGITATHAVIGVVVLGGLAALAATLYLWQTWPPTGVSCLLGRPAPRHRQETVVRDGQRGGRARSADRKRPDTDLMLLADTRTAHRLPDALSFFWVDL
jgi:hypothetical protein